MSNELTTQNNKQVSVFDADQFKHWMSVATHLSTSDMIPKAYKGKAMDILISIDMGRQVGLPIMQALQSVAVINGTPAMFGDAPLAVCQNHPSFEWIKEEPLISKNGDISGYKCTVKRKNNDEHTYTFTIDNAKKANLWGKAGPWSQYPERMLQMRARGFALRNTFPDALKGIQIAEEVQDTVKIEATWEPKKTQQDKLNLLLAKKGFNNANNQQNNDNSNNAPHSNYDTGLCSENSNDSPQASENDVRPCVVPDGESKDRVTLTQNVATFCSIDQLESIEFLCHEKSFDKARQLKALDHFNVSSFAELTSIQATEMIKILNKIE